MRFFFPFEIFSSSLFFTAWKSYTLFDANQWDVTMVVYVWCAVCAYFVMRESWALGAYR